MGEEAGSYAGQDRFECRDNLWKDMENAVSPSCAAVVACIERSGGEYPWVKICPPRASKEVTILLRRWVSLIFTVLYWTSIVSRQVGPMMGPFNVQKRDEVACPPQQCIQMFSVCCTQRKVMSCNMVYVVHAKRA